MLVIREYGATQPAVLDQYVALGKAGSACHDRYREPNSLKRRAAHP